MYQTEVSKIIPWSTVPTVHPVKLEPFTIDNEQYLAAVNFMDENENYNVKSVVFKLNSTTLSFDKVQEFSTSGAVDFQYVDAGLHRYAIFLDFIGSRRTGGPLTHQRSFQVNQYQPEHNEKEPFHYRSRVNTLGAKDVNVFNKVYDFEMYFNYIRQ